MKNKALRIVLQVLSYVLVAVTAAGLTRLLGSNKMTELEWFIKHRYVDEASVDYETLEDVAAAAMIDSLPDGWSYYISAKDYAAYEANRANTFVGVGITVQAREENDGFDILQVTKGGGAEKAGMLPGDVLVEVAGQGVAGMTTSQVSDLIRGEAGTTVKLGVLREGQKKEFTVERAVIQVQVVTSAMVTEDVGYIRIENFHDRSAEDAIAAVEQLRSQGATALVFDVRGNPGGYKDQLVKLLDYLLPEGELFRSIDYKDKVEVDKSDASCVKMPMAVLMDGNSYSAAEFFAAALEEYGWATTVGEQTVGKGHFQVTYRLKDGSAVALSSGRYYTPKGVSLSDVGGLTPNIPVEMDDETAAKLYSGILPYEEDAQLQAAIEAVK